MAHDVNIIWRSDTQVLSDYPGRNSRTPLSGNSRIVGNSSITGLGKSYP